MSYRGDIHILVDTSLKMHVKIDRKKTAMQKVYKFLLNLSKRGDDQPAYFDRVHIHIGDNYIELEKGQANKIIRNSKKIIFELSDQHDILSLWKTALDADDSEDSMFFIISSMVENRVLDMFSKYYKKLFFLDFSGRKFAINNRFKDKLQLVKNEDVANLANTIHKKFLGDYITTVNFGIQFNAEFVPCIGIDKCPIDIKSIDILGSTTYQPLETVTVLARSFILPVNMCYDTKKSKINSTVAYCLLKEMLGEKTEYPNHSYFSRDTSKNKDSKSNRKNEIREDNYEEKQDDIKVEVKEVEDDAEVKQEHFSPGIVKTTPKGKNVGKKKSKPETDDDDDDEEYVPTKRKSARKNTKTIVRGGKRKLTKLEKPEKPKISPKKPRKSLPKENETCKNDTTEEPTEEPTVSQKMEEAEKQSEGQSTESDKPADEPPPDPLFLVGCAAERNTGLRRPVILRLKGLYDDDKTYYDSETLKQKLEEIATKQLEEKKLNTSEPSSSNVVEDSPASPPMDCPASPDMVPVIPQTVKIIPTVPTIPLEPQSAQSSSKDIDYRAKDIDLRTPVKSALLEPANVTTGDVDFRFLDNMQKNDFGNLAGAPIDVIQSTDPHEPTSVNQAELKKESCIVDEALVPEEPAPESVIAVQQKPVVSIPLEGNECGNEPEKFKKEDKEETAGETALKTEKIDFGNHIQVIVLNMTWDQFEHQIAFVDDDETFAELTEREKTIVGPEPYHDYTKLTGWYSPEAMQFYVNKMVRALRKLQERSATFEKEYQHMTRMVIYGQSPEMAQQFAALIRDESYGLPRQAVPFAEGAAQYFDELSTQMLYHPRFKRSNVPRRYIHPPQQPAHPPHIHHPQLPHHPHHAQHHSLHPQYSQLSQHPHLRK